MSDAHREHASFLYVLKYFLRVYAAKSFHILSRLTIHTINIACLDP
jgi:hypothetical protein